MKKILLLISIVFVLIPAASAGGSTYGGIVYSVLEDDANIEISAVGGRVGAFLNENFSVEGRVQIGVGDDEGYDSQSAIAYSVEANTLIGIYSRIGFYISPYVYPYGIIGYSQLDYTVESRGGASSISVDDKESSASFGFGVDVSVSKTTLLNIEYLRLIDESEFEVDALSIGATFRF